MRNKFIYLMLVMTVLLSACSSDDDPIEEPKVFLPVNYANIAGTWQLAEWNGEALEGGRYCYLVINRKANDDGERTLTIYMNMDSNKSRCITSVYELEDDEEMDENPYTAYISGMYDYSAGFWNNDYIISEVESDRMVWTVVGDADDRSVYVRCDDVPEDIIAGTRAID